MVIVTGSAIAREGAEQDMCALAVEHVRRSRLEPGCLSHEVSSDVENPRRLVFFERWADMAALQTHFRIEASRAFAQALGRLADGKPEIAIYAADPIQKA